MSDQNFSALGLSDAVVDVLDDRGFDTPLPIQGMVIPDVLDGRDALVKSPTGSGKTLAFALPISEIVDANDAARPAVLVLAPTRELASQIVDEWHDFAHARALRVTAVYGGVGLQKQAKEAARSHIVVATPGRLEDLLQRGAFRLDRVEVLVLDEADRMLDMGFKPAIDRIVGQCPRDRQTLFFSATLEGEAGRIAQSFTRADAARHAYEPPTRPISEMDHRFVNVTGQDRIAALVDQLKVQRDLAVVFVRTKHGADRLAKRLGRDHGIDAVAMHGGRSQNQREKALARFEDFQVDVLVATDVAARGIDVDGISHVLNFDPPEDRETYVHRTGRTARAGRTGAAVTLVDREQQGEVAEIARALDLHDAFADADLDIDARAPKKKGRGGGGGGGRPPQAGGQPRQDGGRGRGREKARAGSVGGQGGGGRQRTRGGGGERQPRGGDGERQRTRGGGGERQRTRGGGQGRARSGGAGRPGGGRGQGGGRRRDG